MRADASMPVGIVRENRKIDHPWQEYSWLPVAVIANAGPVDVPRQLVAGEGAVQFHVATLPVELFKGETEGYRLNLSQQAPAVFVAMRENDDVEARYRPFLATVCPFEAASYSESGDEIVRGVSMPPEIGAWVETFVTTHHVETPFKKRKNKKHRVEERSTRPRGRFTPEAG